MLSPPTSIADLVALARGAALMVSGDTGPTHIARGRRHAARRHLRADAAARNGPVVAGRCRPCREMRRLPMPSSAAMPAWRRCVCWTSRSRKCWTPSSAPRRVEPSRRA